MRDWTIRDGSEADAPAIAGIVNGEIRSGLAIWRSAERDEAEIAAMIAERLAAGHPVLIAEDGETGGVLGWASYGPFRAGDGYAATVEHSVHIVPEAQGRGVGSDMVVALIDRARERGVHVLVGGIESSNRASIAMHRRLGFEEVGRMPEVGRKFGNWLTLVLMQRIVD